MLHDRLARAFAGILIVNAAVVDESLVVLENVGGDRWFHASAVGFVEDRSSVSGHVGLEMAFCDPGAAMAVYADIHYGTAVQVGLVLNERTIGDPGAAIALLPSQVEYAGAFAGVIPGDGAVADIGAA